MSEPEENELEVPPAEMAAQATAIMPVLRSNVPLPHRLKVTGTCRCSGGSGSKCGIHMSWFQD